MNQSTVVGLMLLVAAATSCQTNSNSDPKTMTNSTLTAPIAEKHDTVLTTHAHERHDPYYWMRERDSEPVVSYLQAENKYAKAVLAPTEGLQKQLFEEIKGRIKEDDASTPYLKAGYYYYTRYEKGKEYPIHCRKQGSLEANEEALLDLNELAKPYAYYAVSGRSVSPDNKILAYGVDTVSRRQYSIHFKYLENGEHAEDVIPNTTGGAAWANDNKTVFYTRKDPVSLRSYRIYRHELGTDVEKDVLVYEETDELYGCFVSRLRSGKYLTIGSYSTLTSEYRLIDTENPTAAFEVFEPRSRGIEYGLEHANGQFYIRTNWEAQNFKLMTCADEARGKTAWKEHVPHRGDVLLQDFEVFENHLVLEERTNGLNQLRIIPNEGEEHYLDFGEDTYDAYISINRENGSNILRYAYNSLTTPASTFDYNMDTREKVLLKQTEVLGGFNSEAYQSERIFATAEDGVQVPISLVYRKDKFKGDGTNPLYLTGYGSYGSSYDAGFGSTRLSLLDRGFVFAIAHIRGGEEMGRSWYEDGKLLKKRNTFTDFIACGEHLVKNQYTSKDQLFASGGSAGGLLMGAIMNMRPDLWRGIVAEVPFVDVVTTMLDTDIPLTTGEFDEWGNPQDKPYYEYMLSYSPYDNVEAKDYPATLVTTGYHDSQVQYWEPAKWVAKLRDHKTDANKLLFVCNMDAGHGGASGRFEAYKEYALQYAFVLSEAGITE